tara:strand:- start:105 stop:218 length:114 start_codon:yes stop_codon:yes gene_type:complete
VAVVVLVGAVDPVEEVPEEVVVPAVANVVPAVANVYR